MMKRAGKWLLAIMLVTAGAAQASVTATVDRNRISINDSLVLTLRSTEGEDLDDVNLTQLERDFDVVSTGTSTRMSIVNGRTERTRDMQVVLLPRRAGELRIPELTVEGQRTYPIVIQVSDTPTGGDSSQDIFVESEVDRDEVYVQSQLLHTFRIFEAIDLNDRGRSELKLDDAVIEELESSSFQRTINGRPYRVIEVKHAIFPQKSGELVIPSMSFNGRKSTGRRTLFSIGSGELIRRRSKPITVNVKPVPAAWPDAPWIPASNLRIEESWSALPDELEVGDSVTRTLTLVAEGIDSSQLPQVLQEDIDGIKAYPDQPRTENRPGNDGITGIGVNSTALLITGPGNFTLPAIRLPWWDTTSDSLRYAELPARSFTVAAPTSPVAAPTSPAPAPVGTAPPMTVIEQTNLWMWATLAALLGWMGTTAWLSWRLRAPRDTKDSNTDSSQREQALFKDCLAACGANNAREARAALQAWGQRFLEHSRLPTLTTLSHHFELPEFTAALEELERSLYAEGEAWRGERLALALKTCRKQGRSKAGSDADPLPPLYSH